MIAESTGGTPSRDIVYLNGERIAMRLYGSQAGWYFFINDHLGTPQKIVNEAGEVVWNGYYQPFGKAAAYPATVTNNIRLPGQYYDAETGLHYNWHRYYDPDTGRYLMLDPIGLDGGLNLYAYVMGNPVNLTDFDGLDATLPFTWWEAVIGAGKEGATIGGGGIAFIAGGIILVTATPAGEGSDIIPDSSSSASINKTVLLMIQLELTMIVKRRANGNVKDTVNMIKLVHLSMFAEEVL